MVADKRHKWAALQHLGGESITALFDELQLLMFRASHGKNQPASLGKLGEERFRNGGSGSCNEDGVEGREFWQSKCSVAAMHVRIGAAKLSQLGRSARSKLWPPLDGENFPVQTRKQRGLITTACADFQNAVRWLQMQRSGHGRDDVRLRNGLSAPDGQRKVIIRVRTHFVGNKFVPRHR